MGCLQRNTALYCCCPFKPAVAAVKRIHLYVYVHLVSLVVGTCSATYLWADGGLWGVMWVLRCQCYVLLRAQCGAGGPMQCKCALLCVATICGVQHRAATVCCYRVLEHSIHIVHRWHSLRSQGDDGATNWFGYCEALCDRLALPGGAGLRGRGIIIIAVFEMYLHVVGWVEIVSLFAMPLLRCWRWVC